MRQPTATPTPNPSPQGGGEQAAANGAVVPSISAEHTLANSAPEPSPIVGAEKIKLWPHRHDAGRVHVALAAVIVPLDVVHVDGRGDALLLVEVAQIVGEVRVVGDAAQIALE